MPANPTRYTIEGLLKRTVLLQNPFDGRTREAREFARWLDALAAEQTRDRKEPLPFSALPFWRQSLTFAFAMISLWLRVDDAHRLTRPLALSMRDENRYLAFTNSLERLAGRLGLSSDAAEATAALRVIRDRYAGRP